MRSPRVVTFHDSVCWLKKPRITTQETMVMVMVKLIVRMAMRIVMMKMIRCTDK